MKTRCFHASGLVVIHKQHFKWRHTPLRDQDLLQMHFPCDQLSWMAQESNKCYTSHYCFKDLFYWFAIWVFLSERFGWDACSLLLSEGCGGFMLFTNGDMGYKLFSQSILWHANRGKIKYMGNSNVTRRLKKSSFYPEATDYTRNFYLEATDYTRNWTAKPTPSRTVHLEMLP